MSGSPRTQRMDDERLSDSLRWYFVLLGSGALVVGRLLADGAAKPDSTSTQIFFRILALGEPLLIALALMYALMVLWQLKKTTPDSSEANANTLWSLTRQQVVTIAVLLTTAMAISLSVRLRGAFPFSMDEWAVRFQSRLFLEGRLIGVPDVATPFLREIARPVFVFAAREGDGWVSGYLPSYSILLMPFEAIGYPWLLNVLCNAGSVWAVAHIGRTMWGADDNRTLVAALALAASSQFIAAAATSYSMSAHLFVNLLWLAAILGAGRVWLWAGPLAFVALTLHQPVPHALFAAPFMLRYLLERQFARLGWLLIWWIAAGGVVLWWSDLMTGRLPTFGANGVLYWPTAAALVVMLLHAVLLFTWSSPLMPLLLLIACRRWDERSATERDLAAGVLLTLSFYLFFRLVTQGHGWGWRYGHQVLGSVAILAASGWPRFRAVIGCQAAGRCLALSLVFSLAVQFPIRMHLMRQLTLPFAKAGSWLRTQPERYLVLPTDSLWYGQDLVRNDASLERPVLLHGSGLSAEEIRSLQSEPGSTVRRVPVDELVVFGLERLPTPRGR